MGNIWKPLDFTFVLNAMMLTSRSGRLIVFSMKLTIAIVCLSFFPSAVFASNLAVDDLLGCYQFHGQEMAGQFHIEKDHVQTGSDSISQFPGKVLLSIVDISGTTIKKTFYQLENDAGNWKSLGDTSLQYFSSTPIVEDKIGIASDFVTFVVDKNGLLVLSYLSLISGEGPTVQQTRFGYVLERTHCPWSQL